MLRIGDPAPSFRLTSTAGREVSLEDFRGHKVVLYFYPKDETPGCTREACDFRDNMHRLSDAGAVVLGVSPDSIDSHHSFRANHDLPFDLLSDPEHTLAEAYGAYGEKISYGTPTMGIIRSTVVIDELGYVDAIWSPVTVDGHVNQVIDFLYGRTSSPEEPTLGAGNGAEPREKPKKAAAPKPAKAAAKPAAPKPAAKPAAKPAKKTAKKATKKATKKAVKKAAKKAAKKVAKKAAARPVAKKAAKKVSKKATKKAARKVAKKVTKKAAKKATKKATKKSAKKATKKAKKR